MTTTGHYVVIKAILFETITIALSVVTQAIFAEEIKVIVTTIVALKVSPIAGRIIIFYMDSHHGNLDDGRKNGPRGLQREERNRNHYRPTDEENQPVIFP
jgi:hypothetical protein